MKILICAKEVRDPDAVDNYVLHGKLEIGPDGKTLTQTSIARLMNAYDEQAIEAALRLRDTGAECIIGVVSVGTDPANILRHAAAMGADEITHIVADAESLDGHGVAALLSAYVRSIGGVDLLLCGRQASDDDQGIVPPLLAESLGMPIITVARAVELTSSDPPGVRVTRVTPNGDEVVEAACPVIVTISNELGQARYPTTARTMKARKMKPTVVSAEQLGLPPDALAPRVTLTRQIVPAVQGNCEFIEGNGAAEVVERLLARLREARVIE